MEGVIEMNLRFKDWEQANEIIFKAINKYPIVNEVGGNIIMFMGLFEITPPEKYEDSFERTRLNLMEDLNVIFDLERDADIIKEQIKAVEAEYVFELKSAVAGIFGIPGNAHDLKRFSTLLRDKVVSR